MNFLFHFELAAQDLESDHAAVGAMLPDLWRMAARSARTRRDVAADAAGDNPLLRQLLQGIEHHLDIDTWFHKSAFFAEGETIARTTLARTGSPRMGLFGHVVWEMCLDGALLRLRGTDVMATRVRQALGVTRDAARLAGDLHHSAARARNSVEPELFESRMNRVLEAVASFTLPAGYANAEGIAQRAGGIRASFALPTPSASEYLNWLSAIKELEPLADRAAGDITNLKCAVVSTSPPNTP